MFKNFVKAIDQTAAGFACSHQKFSSKSDAKPKAEIFAGPEIRKLIKVKRFGKNLAVLEKEVYSQFCFVVYTFLEIHKSGYASIIESFIKARKTLAEECH